MQTTFTTVTGAISTTYRVELGSRGPQGIQGPPNILSIGTVTTGAPGSSASASISGTSPSQTLDLEIPRGDVGPPGPTDYNLLTNVPATFPPSAHTHVVSNITPVSGTHLIGRHAGGSGNAQEVSVGNGVEFQGSGIRRSALTGDVTASAGSNATTIANDAVTTAKIINDAVTTAKIINDAVTTAKIINDAVTNAKLANMATATIKGRTTAGTGDPEDLSPAQARTVIGVSPALVVSDTAPVSPEDGQQWLGLTAEVLHIWSNTKSRWISINSDFDADAAAYIAAVVAAGATVTANQRAYINAFYVTGKRDGWYSSIKRLYLPIWQTELPNAVDMISLATGTFVGTVTHGAGFVKSDVSTGYMNANVGLTTLGLSLNSYHYAGLYKESSSQSNSYLFGSASGSNQNRLFVSSATMNADLSSASLGRASGTVASGNRLGIFTFSGNASNRFLKQRKTSGVTTLGTTTTTITAAPNNENVAFLARNNAGTIDGFCGEEIGAFSLGLELTDTQDSNYSLALKILWENCTNLVLP
jgi:hypothetical protein